MTIREALNSATAKLKNISTSPSLDAEVLLAFVLKKDKTYLHTNSKKKLLRNYLRNYSKLIQKRSKGWPVAYLTGHKEFYSLNFLINKDVLIPRPETEGLVDLVLKHVQIPDSRFQILDIGTGSGCIIISLACNLNPATCNLHASDVSPKALAIARQNARRHKVKIHFKQGDLLAPWKNQRFDIIVANLPYGWLAWKNNSSAESASLKFEPRQALFTENRGLKLIKNLLQQISVIPAKAGIQTSGSRIKSGMTIMPRYIFLEFDPRQAKQIKNLAAKLLPGFKTKILKDLSGRARYAVLSR